MLKKLISAVICTAIMAGLVIARHHENIGRLIKGKERKISDKKRKKG